MRKINLCLGIHNHQPVGNFDSVFEEAYQRAYLAFQEVLERHPKIKIAQHFTGILFDWIKKHQPSFIPRVKKLVAREQVEMMTGGFYEPIMSVIPDEDKLGQIRKLTDFVKKHTGYEATGMWLAERIWEPHLPRPLAQAGIKYVVLDDSHFRAAGLPPEQLLGYFVTEEQGYDLDLFPISERMRYLIPFRDPEETIEYLRSVADDSGTKLVVYADDGEKFGAWPNTYKHCYEDGWLDRFFTALDKNSDWINILHFSEALQILRPAGRVYLPTASYREMMEWAMPAPAILRYEEFEGTLRQARLFDQYKDFVRGGFWRNFLIKYPEINNMHKKMLLVSRRLNRLQGVGKNGAKLKRAIDHLWASQCNCPYWHGVFGGAYLNHLRYAIYHEMLKAEVTADALEHSPTARKKGWVSFSELDFDLDGSLEILVSTKSLNAYLSPSNGGTLFELDFKPKAMNLMDSMSRRQEAYHQKLLNMKNHKPSSEGIASIHDMVVAKEEGLEKRLHYDWYRRSSLIDHFLEPGTTLEQFASAQYNEKGSFVNQPYQAKMELRSSRSGKNSGKGVGAGRMQRLTLWRQGQVWVGGHLLPVEVRKSIAFEPLKARLQIGYTVSNLSAQAVELWFGTEFLFALLAGDTDDRYYTFPDHSLTHAQLGSSGVVENVRHVRLTEGWLNIKIDLKSEAAATCWHFPIETISQSEAGFERVYQSSIVFPNWHLRLEGGKSWNNALTLHIS